MNLEGKVINFLGDSITQGVGVTDQNNRYDRVILQKGRLKAANNYGISGTRIAHQEKCSENPQWDLCFCGRAVGMDRNADIVVVFGGTNDYGHGDAPFGTPADTTPATFCGAVDWLMTHLQTAYAGKTVVFLTPAHRKDDGQPSCNAGKKPDAKPLAQYCSVIEQKGAQKSIPVLNLQKTLPIDPNIPEDFDRYTTDGVHFNDAGHRLIAETVLNFLATL